MGLQAAPRLSIWRPVPLDVDGDGDLDLIDDDRVFLNFGGLSFQDTGMPAPMSWSDNFEVVDVDGDGDQDVLAHPAFAGTDNGPFVLRNDWPAGFVRYAPNTANLPTPGDIAVGDLDGDGHPDLLQTDRTQRQGADQYGRLRFGDGAGDFTRSRILRGVGPSVRFGDLDGDGDLDIASTTVQGWPGGGLWIHRNDGRGRFTRLPTQSGSSGLGFRLLDLDEDGDLDLMFEERGGRFLANDGTGQFQPFGYDFDAGTEDTFFTNVGDLDGDGDVDLVSGNQFHVNLTRQLLAPGSAVAGLGFDLEAYGPGGGVGGLWFAPRLRGAPLPLAGLGNLYLDPGLLQLVEGATLDPAAARSSATPCRVIRRCSAGRSASRRWWAIGPAPCG